MFAPDDTIVAVATPEGRAGLGVIRVSGPAAADVARALLGRTRPLPRRRAVLGRVREATCARGNGAGWIDQVVATYFKAPASYTGEDVVEIGAHGNPVLLRQIVAAAIRAGARLARPGEFTFRAYLHGRLDLVQAEAVADLIEAVTPAQTRVAFDQLEGTLTRAIQSVEAEIFDVIVRLEASLDFSEEGYHFIDRTALGAALDGAGVKLGGLLASADRGQLVREGALVALIGRPNVGKSSVFNALVGVERAIVADEPGTTRDLVTEVVEIQGIPVTLTDTAGLREAAGGVEREGVTRARQAAARARATVVVLDGSMALTAADENLLARQTATTVIAVNKNDLPAAWPTGDRGWSHVVRLSAKTGEGVDKLREAIASVLSGPDWAVETPAMSNLRHRSLVSKAQASLQAGMAACRDGAPEEIVLVDLHETIRCLEEVTGRRTPDDVLGEIFGRFCIGK